MALDEYPNQSSIAVADAYEADDPKRPGYPETLFDVDWEG